jgi:hypothetical protein
MRCSSCSIKRRLSACSAARRAAASLDLLSRGDVRVFCRVRRFLSLSLDLLAVLETPLPSELLRPLAETKFLATLRLLPLLVSVKEVRPDTLGDVLRVDDPKCRRSFSDFVDDDARPVAAKSPPSTVFKFDTPTTLPF